MRRSREYFEEKQIDIETSEREREREGDREEEGRKESRGEGEGGGRGEVNKNSLGELWGQRAYSPEGDR